MIRNRLARSLLGFRVIRNTSDRSAGGIETVNDTVMAKAKRKNKTKQAAVRERKRNKIPASAQTNELFEQDAKGRIGQYGATGGRR